MEPEGITRAWPSVDQQEDEDDPHPGDDFALNAFAAGRSFLGFCGLWLNRFHSSPTPLFYLVITFCKFNRRLSARLT
jgi:hypothetical protein